MILRTALAAAAAIVCASCSSTPRAAAKPAGESATPAPVARVTRQDLARDLELSAEFRPYQEIELHAKVSGYLKTIHVDIGDYVKAGQLIAELEVPELTLEQEHAVAALRTAQIEVERTRGNLRRAEAAAGLRRVAHERLSSVIKARPNLVAQQEVDEAAWRWREAEAQLAAEKAAVASREEQVRASAAVKARTDTMASYLRITAPFSGMITSRYGDPGAMIQAGTASQTQAMPVVRLSEVDRLRLVLPIPESVVPRIAIGSPVEVRVDALNRVFQGKICRYTGRLNASTRTMDAEVDIQNPRRVLKPGMYATVAVKLDRREDALAVPVQALSGHGPSATVLVVNAGRRLEERRVNLGVETPNLIEVLAGLRENDLVVLGNRARFKPGMLVQAKMIDAAELKEAH